VPARGLDSGHIATEVDRLIGERDNPAVAVAEPRISAQKGQPATMSALTRRKRSHSRHHSRSLATVPPSRPQGIFRQCECDAVVVEATRFDSHRPYRLR